MKQQVQNELILRFPALSVNEGAARAMVGAFCAQYDPTIEQLADIKCALSEAVTNCIVHAYAERGGPILVKITLLEGRRVRMEIRDRGCGIADVAEARKPLFTTDKTGERSGMGFAVMESFTDRLLVHSKPGHGTTVIMQKQL